MLSFLPSFDTLFNTIGIAGMIAILFAYFMQQAGRWVFNEPLGPTTRREFLTMARANIARNRPG